MSSPRPNPKAFAGKPRTSAQVAATEEIATAHLSEATRRELAELEARETAPPIQLSPEERAKLEKEKAVLLEDARWDTTSEKSAGPKLIAKLREGDGQRDAPASGHITTEPAPAPARPRSLVGKALADHPVPEPVVHEAPPVAERFGLVPPPELPSTSPLTLAAAAAKFTRSAQTNQKIDRGFRDEKANEARARLTPLIAKARATLAAVEQLWQEHKGPLTTFANSTWADTPREWSRDLRLRAERDIFRPAEDLVALFNSRLAAGTYLARVEQFLAQGARGGFTVLDYERDLQRGHADTKSIIDSLNFEIGVIATKLATLEAVTAHIPVGPPKPEVEVLITGKDRASKNELLSIIKAKANPLPTQASGMHEPILPLIDRD